MSFHLYYPLWPKPLKPRVVSSSGFSGFIFLRCLDCCLVGKCILWQTNLTCNEFSLFSILQMGQQLHWNIYPPLFCVHCFLLKSTYWYFPDFITSFKKVIVESITYYNPLTPCNPLHSLPRPSPLYHLWPDYRCDKEYKDIKGIMNLALASNLPE